MNTHIRFKPYSGAAAGWGALISVTRNWVKSENAISNIKAMIKTNQNGGFDCPGCAWGESPKGGLVKFCENGAKAVNWEATSRRVDPGFFSNYTISALSEQTDYWLEQQGRLTHPVQYDRLTDKYVGISWDDAYNIIGTKLRSLDSPNEADFYTSGRASNEAAFLYQLFVRAFGTNNFPDCSNMCHEASGIGMGDAIGSVKGTVVFDDFEEADAIFVIGQNPGTNHPRMLEPLRDAVKRGAEVVIFNTLKERGLERFQHPQHPVEMLTNSSKPTSTAYYQPALGGDMAAIRGMVKYLLQWEREAVEAGAPPVFDHSFIDSHTHGVSAYIDEVDATSWSHIESQSGLELKEIEEVAKIYWKADRVIMCWAMGVTQHKHSVAIVQEIINLQLLRGNLGKPGAGLSPIRGHSNVQGDRTMGIDEKPSTRFLDALEHRFKFQVPRNPGHNTIGTITSMESGTTKVFIALGGNFSQATPDSIRTHAAIRKCDLTVHIATKLNRSHLVMGHNALILPCLGRTDIDIQKSGPQGITVEDTFSMVHLSFGQLKPLSNMQKSEPDIIAGIAKATLGNHPIDWTWAIEDYSRIRELIADVIIGFTDFNNKLKHPGGFYLGNSAALREWHTISNRAQFTPNALPIDLVNKGIRSLDKSVHLILQTLRSHDQYNTTLYGLDDRYRGIYGTRQVIFVNQEDINRLGFSAGDKVDITSLWVDGRERKVFGFTLIPYDTPLGQAAAYYPETNPLVPLESFGERTFTPTSKFVAIRLATAQPDALIQIAR